MNIIKGVEDFSKYKYECVEVITEEYEEVLNNGKTKLKKRKKVIARLFNPENNQSTFHDVTRHSIPDVFIADGKIKTSEYKSYLDEGVPLSKYKFKDLEEYSKFIRDIKKDVLDENGNVLTKEIEYDGEWITIDVTEFEDTAFGYQNLQHTFIHRNFPFALKSIHEFRTWFLDIETRSDFEYQGFPSGSFAPEQVTAIQIYDNFTKQYIILGRKDFTGKFDEHLNVKFIKIENEAKLLEMFLRLMEKMNPGIISGWNSMTFDLPYLTNRIARVLDGYKGDFREEMNLKTSYKNMPNVSRLSPIGVVEGIPKVSTGDGMDGTGVRWKGILLIDYKELAIKYGFLGLPSYSLKNVAKHFELSQKIDTSQYKKFDNTYTGDGWIEPMEPDRTDEVTEYQMGYKEGKYTWEEVEQVVYNRFIDYSLRDVEILVELHEIARYLESHKGIAYTCSVDMNDCWGTQKHWVSMIYREGFDKKIILPLKQQFADPYSIYSGGWTKTVPGKYDFVTSFDFASLYPSLIRAFNIGGDTYIKDYQLPPELLALRKKFFTYFTPEMLNKEEYPDAVVRDGVEILGEHHPLGSIVLKYGADNVNDVEEEGEYFTNLMDNWEEISTVLKKYNVSASPNGYFYDNSVQSILAERMETIFNERIQEKRAGQKAEGELELVKKEMAKRGLTLD